MKQKLISMLDFVLEMDSLTTKEFCDKYNIPIPILDNRVTGLLQIDAIKLKHINEYAKFLKQELTPDILIHIFNCTKINDEYRYKDIIFFFSKTYKHISLYDSENNIGYTIHYIGDMVDLGLEFDVKF